MLISLWFVGNVVILPAEKTDSTVKKIKVYFSSWKNFGKLCYNVALYGFALAGLAIIGAWAVYQLGWTKNRGAVDSNNRYLAQVSEMNAKNKKTGKIDVDKLAEDYAKLSVISKLYPRNAELMMQAINNAHGGVDVSQMIAACELYIKDEPEYVSLLAKQKSSLASVAAKETGRHAILWMNTPEWEALKAAIVKDKALIDSAAMVTGVEARLIVGCLIGEQIRLFNSKREMYKKYLGPVKVLSVQSQFSFGVNGIKDFTAAWVERNLKDDTSAFYMGKRYEHILDFKTADHQTERINRLVDYRNHYYSYVYTGCIIHQTKKQWERAGFNISNRPEILFTLFNIGFSESHPSANPQCGGSHITVADKVYTFGAIGFDFYYSGELAKEFPYNEKHFED